MLELHSLLENNFHRERFKDTYDKETPIKYMIIKINNIQKNNLNKIYFINL